MRIGKDHQTGAQSLDRVTCPLLIHSLAESQKVTNPQSPSSQTPAPVRVSLSLKATRSQRKGETFEEDDEDTQRRVEKMEMRFDGKWRKSISLSLFF